MLQPSVIAYEAKILNTANTDIILIILTTVHIVYWTDYVSCE